MVWSTGIELNKTKYKVKEENIYFNIEFCGFYYYYYYSLYLWYFCLGYQLDIKLSFISVVCCIWEICYDFVKFNWISLWCFVAIARGIVELYIINISFEPNVLSFFGKKIQLKLCKFLILMMILVFFLCFLYFDGKRGI